MSRVTVRTSAFTALILIAASLSASPQDRSGSDGFFKARASAEQGDVSAQFYLGDIYYGGAGVPQNYKKAAKWYRMAAEQGHAPAQSSLGFMYEKGEGVPQDYTEAAKWFRRAAEQGDASAQFHLGFMYFEGKGVPQNFRDSYIWFSLSAAGGLAEAIGVRDRIAGFLSASELSEAQKEAVHRHASIQRQ